MSKEYKNYNLGDKVTEGTISYIYGSGLNYILFEVNNNGGLVWSTKGDSSGQLQHINPLLTEIDSLYDDKNKQKEYISRIARAHLECFQGNISAANEVLGEVKKSIIRKKLIYSKIVYLSSAIIFVCINLIIAAVLNYAVSEYIAPNLIMIFTITTFGSLGGLLSISININKLDLDIDGGRFIKIITGITRIFISMVSSLIIYCIIKANLLFGIMNQIDNNFLYYSFAVVSGFSETFLPNIIKSIEKEKPPNK